METLIALFLIAAPQKSVQTESNVSTTELSRAEKHNEKPELRNDSINDEIVQQTPEKDLKPWRKNMKPKTEDIGEVLGENVDAEIKETPKPWRQNMKKSISTETKKSEFLTTTNFCGNYTMKIRDSLGKISFPKIPPFPMSKSQH